MAARQIERHLQCDREEGRGKGKGQNSSADCSITINNF